MTVRFFFMLYGMSVLASEGTNTDSSGPFLETKLEEDLTRRKIDLPMSVRVGFLTWGVIVCVGGCWCAADVVSDSFGRCNFRASLGSFSTSFVLSFPFALSSFSFAFSSFSLARFPLSLSFSLALSASFPVSFFKSPVPRVTTLEDRPREPPMPPILINPAELALLGIVAGPESTIRAEVDASFNIPSSTGNAEENPGEKGGEWAGPDVGGMNEKFEAVGDLATETCDETIAPGWSAVNVGMLGRRNACSAMFEADRKPVAYMEVEWARLEPGGRACLRMWCWVQGEADCD